jgi:hypothetical protein
MAIACFAEHAPASAKTDRSEKKCATAQILRDFAVSRTRGLGIIDGESPFLLT